MKTSATAVAILITMALMPPAHAAPTIALTSPGSGIVSGTVKLDASASGAVRVDYLLDGVRIAFDATCCSWDETWDTRTAKEGGHLITAVASDAAGVVGTTPAVPIMIQNTAAPAPAPSQTATPAPVPIPSPTPPPVATSPVASPVASPVPSPTQVPTGTVPCIGAPADAPVRAYPWPTTFVDAQAWWGPTRVGQTQKDLGHVHVGSCIPERESITGTTMPIDLRVILHNNPGTVTYVSVVVKGTNYEDTVAKLSDPTLVGVPGLTVTRWLHYDLPLSTFQASGLQEIRYRVFVDEPATSDTMHSSINYQTTIENGRPRSDVTRLPFLRMKGWYTGAGYCESSYRSDITPLPDAPVTGSWEPQLRMLWHGEPSDRKVTHHAVRIDPDFHAVPPVEGIIRRYADGPWEGVLPIDTTSLTPGVHRLHMKADCDDPRATNSGVGVVAFEVGA